MLSQCISVLISTIKWMFTYTHSQTHTILHKISSFLWCHRYRIIQRPFWISVALSIFFMIHFIHVSIPACKSAYESSRWTWRRCLELKSIHLFVHQQQRLSFSNGIWILGYRLEYHKVVFVKSVYIFFPLN